jgi:hypothetical protein
VEGSFDQAHAGVVTALPMCLGSVLGFYLPLALDGMIVVGIALLTD